MPDELIPGNTPALTPPPAPTSGKKSITCEFCNCTLSPNGDYIALSERAKELRGQSETIDRLKETIEQLQGSVRTAEQQRDEARQLVKPADRLFTW